MESTSTDESVLNLSDNDQVSIHEDQLETVDSLEISSTFNEPSTSSHIQECVPYGMSSWPETILKAQQWGNDSGECDVPSDETHGIEADETSARLKEDVLSLSPFSDTLGIQNPEILTADSYSETRSFKCDVCGMQFHIEDDLNVHRNYHQLEESHACVTRKEGFDTNTQLKTQKRVRTLKKRYECETCKKKFKSNYNLNRHKRTHTGEKPFKCEVCKREYRDASNFIKHKSLHTGAKPFQCQICERKFRLKSNVNKHMLIHTREKRFQCDICKRRFGRTHNLTRHRRSVHKDEIPE